MSNIPLLSGSTAIDAMPNAASFNALIQNINAGVAGLLFANLATGATGANTTATDLQAFTLPAGS
jgi:hypothetical protein